MDKKKLAEALIVPEQESGPLPFDLNIKALQAWRDGLPLANLQETTRRVYTLLREVNRLKASEKQRLGFLEALSPSIDYVSQGLSKGCQDHAHPLPEKVTRLVRLNQEILSEAAIGHKIMVRDWLSRRFLFGGRERQLADGMQAVLHYLGRIVLESYRTYVPFPDGLWGEIHAIYQAAEQRRVGHLKSEAFSERGRMTLADSYMRTVLLALASPYHLERGTIDTIYKCLTEWSSACRLKPLAECDDDEMHIVVRLDGNAPPFFQVMESADRSGLEDAGNSQVLEASGLNAIVESELEKIKNRDQHSKEKPLLRPDVLVVLRDCWSGPTTRGESRYHGEVDVEVAVGLNAAHFFLTHGHGTSADEIGTEPVEASSEEEGSAALELSVEITERAVDMDGSLITSIDQKRDHVAEMLMPAEVAASWTQTRSHESPRSHTCTTVDFSANGLQVLCPPKTDLTLNVGDLVCLGFDEGAQGRWKLGTVRWIRQRSEGDTQVGIWILASEGRGVKAGVCDDRGYYSDLSSCVELPGHEGPTLLTPRMPFAKGKVAVIIDGDEQHFVRLGSNVESVNRFARFEYSALSVHETEKFESAKDRDRPVGAVRDRKMRSLMEGRELPENVDDILEDDTGLWDTMPKDW